MVDIFYLGKKSFKIKGKKASLVINPLKTLSSEDTLLFSQKEVGQNFEPSQEEKILINGPGEYEINGVEIFGIGVYGEKNTTIYQIKIDGVTIIHLGDLTTKLDENLIDKFEESDVLMVPVEKSSDLIKQIQPKIAVLMDYQPENLPSLLKTVEFPIEKISGKLSLGKEKLPDQTKLVVFETVSKIK